MTGKEMKQIIDELKAEGNSDEEILAGCYDLYKDGQFNEKDLEVIASFLGYELKPEFLAMSEEERKSIKEEDFADDEVKEADGAEKAAPADGDGNAPKELPKEPENNNNPAPEKKEEESEPQESEEDEKARARKLFGFDK